MHTPLVLLAALDLNRKLSKKMPREAGDGFCDELATEAVRASTVALHRLLAALCQFNMGFKTLLMPLTALSMSCLRRLKSHSMHLANTSLRQKQQQQQRQQQQQQQNTSDGTRLQYGYDVQHRPCKAADDSDHASIPRLMQGHCQLHHECVAPRHRLCKDMY
jgi:heme exporter protein D